MENHISKNMELMKKVIEERKAKSTKQKSPKIASTYGTQSPGADKNK